MHREDHAGRAAGLTELVAHIGHVADAEALASESLWHLDAEQMLCLDRLECFRGEARGAIDRNRMTGRDGGYGSGACG